MQPLSGWDRDNLAWRRLHRTLQSLLSSSFLLETHFSIWRMSQCSGNLTGAGETDTLSSAREITKYHRQQAPEAASCPWTLSPAREWLARASLNRNYLWREGTQEGQVIHQIDACSARSTMTESPHVNTSAKS